MAERGELWGIVNNVLYRREGLNDTQQYFKKIFGTLCVVVNKTGVDDKSAPVL